MTAAAAKLLQLCPTLCNPIDDSLLGSSVPGILQARILEWVAIFFSIIIDYSYRNGSILPKNVTSSWELGGLTRHLCALIKEGCEEYSIILVK